MTRRDVGLAVLVGAIIGAYLAFKGLTPSSLPAYAIGYWYVGVVLLVIGAAFAWRHLPAKVPRILGSIGLGWVTMIDRKSVV